MITEMKKYRLIVLFLIVAGFVSCDNFLSERPSKSSDIVPSTIADMETILAGIWRDDCISSHLAYMSDDVTLSQEIEKSKPGAYSLESVMCATWERNEVHKAFKDYMWMYRYQNIFRSNLVLATLPKIDASESEITRVKAEACFRRAYSYMELLNIYTLPYSAKNLGEPGLVLNKTTAFDSSLERATLEETYAFIESDLIEALKIDVQLENKSGQGSFSRATIASANALAARFYLIKHDYPNAKKYAQAALDGYGESNIMNYNDLTYAPNIDEGTIVIDGVEIKFEVKYPETATGYDFINKWTEDYFAGYAGDSFGSGMLRFNLPSQELIDTYGADGDREKDMRWNYFFVSNFTYLNAFPVDLPYYYRYSYRNYCITVPEMLLIVAECEARAGDYNIAMQKVNMLRAKRIAPDGQVTLSASGKENAIAIVLRERRRELPLMMRLFDIRRYNSNDDPNDDVTVTRNFYAYNTSAVDMTSVKKYELKPGDRRYAAPIPEGDILAGKGVLKQNQY